MPLKLILREVKIFYFLSESLLDELPNIGMFGPAFVELILDRIDFVGIDLVRINFEVK